MAISTAPASAGPLVAPQFGAGKKCPFCGKGALEPSGGGKLKCPECSAVVKGGADSSPKGFHLDMEVKAVEGNNGTLVLEGYASTWDLDRDGDNVVPEAFAKSLTGYLENNPILLLNHDRARPIGLITKAVPDPRGLKITAEVPRPAAGEEGWKHSAYGAIKRGVLKALSIGGVFLRDKKQPQTIQEVDLYEVSVVSVPSNPTSLFRVAGEKGLRFADLKADDNPDDDDEADDVTVVPSGMGAIGGPLQDQLDFWLDEFGENEPEDAALQMNACVATFANQDGVDDPVAFCSWLRSEAQEAPDAGAKAAVKEVALKNVRGAGKAAAPPDDNDDDEGVQVDHTHAKEGGGKVTHSHDDAEPGHDHDGLLPTIADGKAVGRNNTPQGVTTMSDEVKSAPLGDDAVVSGKQAKALLEKLEMLESKEREREMERQAETKAAERLVAEEKAEEKAAQAQRDEEKRLGELIETKMASMRGGRKYTFSQTAGGTDGSVPAPKQESLVQLLRAKARGDLTAHQQLADMSAKAAAELGIKAIGEGSGSGGYLVPPQFWQQGIAEFRLAAARVRQLLTVITGVNSNLVYIPRETGIASVGWTAENAVKPSTDQTFGQISVNIFTLAGISKVSNQLLEDSSPAVDQIVRKDLGRLLGQAEDIALLNGTGSGQPTGVLGTAGVLTGAIGAATYADAIATAISAIQSNYFGSPDGIVMHPRDVNKLRTAKDSNGRYIFEPAFFAGNSPLNAAFSSSGVGNLGGGYSDMPSMGGPEGTVWGLPIYSDANMPSNLGTGANETRIVVGAWKEAYLLERSGVTLDVSSEAGAAFESNQTWFRAEERMGATFARQPAAFFSVTGLTP